MAKECQRYYRFASASPATPEISGVSLIDSLHKLCFRGSGAFRCNEVFYSRPGYHQIRVQDTQMLKRCMLSTEVSMLWPSKMEVCLVWCTFPCCILWRAEVFWGQNYLAEYEGKPAFDTQRERERERERDSNSVKFQVTSPRLFKGAYLKKACCNHSPSPSIRPPSCFRQQVRIQPQQSRMVRRMQRTALNSGSVSFAVAEHAQWCGN